MRKNFTPPHPILFFSIVVMLIAAGCGKGSTPAPAGTAANYTGSVTIYAGGGASGDDAGIKNASDTSARFYFPTGVVADASGNLFVADAGNNMIREITTDRKVTTFAGTGPPGLVNGAGNTARFSYPYAVAVDATGNIYVADQGNSVIRKITAAGVASTFAGNGSQGSANGDAATASFYDPSGVAVDATGNVYVVDQGNNLIRKITPAGTVSTFAGSGKTGVANGTGTAASFSIPVGIAIDAAGNIYVADSFNNMIRKITPAGVVTTLAGTGVSGSKNGAANVATFSNPQALAVDASGNVYVADTSNNLIRKIDNTGAVTTYAGTGDSGETGGYLIQASFRNPTGITVDKAGNVFVADHGNHVIRLLATHS
jgi:serine/threonine-protein kinase